ncbi:MAG TPA: FumA C-terminus/TtdB family hydratase beta subunit [Anaerohalosphaeraceae bacterium]|nr:FumA C-terminus/TtdB family hydratase beta subunit [Anaerohalosphaeraceae bacterium]HOL30573.1 FumA C-terminus/TtdB family hydratase beta subunit [Anaerohalosphaeraceae bacterium]HOM75057.1 FumA C-terminus/TtdB family hydratase beta subunit [Anaerohalosphaeraceae bacterium]HPC63606.1 FumA C-terminus/TtdB family hydratase beta subunit [Anaerohalosphaeraceae bacterium]HPO68860.1 FumA C-terminus/TtdB family hydratase beta subunit [Anaerohalosphaeraceae bacterium]
MKNRAESYSQNHMTNKKIITTPLDNAVVQHLHAGDEVLICGTVFAARDQAHKRFCDCIAQGRPLPAAIEGALIYFVGPTPAPPGKIIGAAGPTTSSRMDAFTPMLLAYGLKGTIGKGYRSQAVRDALVKYGGVHFSALGGAGALLSRHIVRNEIAAYEDLGPEAVRLLEFKDFPAVVAYDCWGKSVYDR